MGGVVGYFLYTFIRLHLNFKRRTELQNQAKLIDLENERKLIAADLHDDLGPMLTAINMRLNEVHPVNEREQTLLNQAIGHVEHIYSHLRNVSSMMVPRFLESRGPLYAIEDFLSNYDFKSSLDIKILPVAPVGLSSDASLHAFRMIQEIIHNTVKHANAKRLRITGHVIKNTLLVETIDDGIGFNEDKAKMAPGLGLQNLYLRAKIINAKLTLKSSAGKGTRYIIEIPFK
jgi:signal transduction histidine kinase